MSRVLLYGSVARGDASAHSDIDLVAVFDDIDYSQRLQLRVSLARAAEEVAGRPVEVHVTDRPEWQRRTCTVSSSFEAGIAPTAVTLIDRPAGAVNWDKEIGLPDNNIDEALGRLDEVAKALNSMSRALLPDEWEIVETRDESLPHWRMIDICSAAAMAIETAIKALAALAGTPAPFKHKIDLLVPLAGEHADAVSDALAEFEHNDVSDDRAPYGDISIWRKAGTYIADRPDIDLRVTSALAPRIARAAVIVATIAASEAAGERTDSPVLARIRPIIARAAETLDNHDLLTGSRL